MFSLKLLPKIKKIVTVSLIYLIKVIVEEWETLCTLKFYCAHFVPHGCRIQRCSHQIRASRYCAQRAGQRSRIFCRHVCETDHRIVQVRLLSPHYSICSLNFESNGVLGKSLAILSWILLLFRHFAFLILFCSTYIQNLQKWNLCIFDFLRLQSSFVLSPLI